jgi:hypothetical protein
MQRFVQGAQPVLGYESVTVDNTSGGVKLTPTKFELFDSTSGARRQANIAFLSVEGYEIRYMHDPGTAVTSSEGHLAEPGDIIELQSISQVRNFRAIRTGANSATLRVTYFG